MRKKIRVAILFGGRSAEHEVSLQSAKNIIDAIDKNKYIPVPIGITKNGQWITFTDSGYLKNKNNPLAIQINEKSADKVKFSILPQTISDRKKEKSFDVVFPVLHGPFGEDGTVQGMLKLLGVPFVGAGVLGSALGMDKDVMKRLIKESGMLVADFITVYDHEVKKIDPKVVFKKLGKTVFVKPGNLGSSVGVSRVSSAAELKKALDIAFKYDRKALIEKYVEGREIECSVLGNETPIASVAGEIIPHDSFYSYNAKYIDEKGASLVIPANLSKKTLAQVQKAAIKTFKILSCEGMARVDFFLTKTGEIFVNEINTIPGFTKISMYPKLWEASGISYPDLIDRLITLATERFKKERKLRTAVDI